jgi:hypothetical protein
MLQMVSFKVGWKINIQSFNKFKHHPLDNIEVLEKAIVVKILEF